MRTSSIAAKAIYAMFFLSGISGLIYETIWLRMLTRILGNTVYATSVILCAFMAGLAIGSFVLGKISGSAKDSLRLYAFLEMGVALSAIALVPVFSHLTPLYRLIYATASGHRLVLTFSQSLIMIVLLLVPTSLMGGTLPVLGAFIKRNHRSLEGRMGILYGFNTLGAFIGVVGSGMFTIGAWGESETLFIGVIINATMSLLAFAMSGLQHRALPLNNSQTNPVSDPQTPGISIRGPAVTRKFILVAYALSGFAAISYEIVWTRLFQIQLGTSMYAFSMVLGCYLLGIALGSLAGGTLALKKDTNVKVFGWLQLFVALYSLIGMFLLTRFAPASFFETLVLTNVITLPLLVVTPLTFALGLMFSVVSTLYIDERETGRDVGRIYSANTAGCIAGSLACGFILIYLLGTRGTMILLAGVNIWVGGYVLLKINGRIMKSIAGLVIIAILFVAFFSPDPFLSALKKAMAQAYGPQTSKIQIYYHRENVAATTTACGAKEEPHKKQLFINGICITKLCTETKLMAHLPLMLHPAPHNVLVVCFGMGTALRSAWSHKGVDCDVVELVGETYDCFKYFHANADQVLSDPRVRHFVDDGRNFLLMRSKKYDVITIDPAPPIWSAGTVNLYTKEFFESCREHLASKGIMCLWVPPAAFSEVRMIMKTYLKVFPNTSVWRGPRYAGFYMIGSDRPPDTSIGRFREALSDKMVEADINEWEPQPVRPEDIGNMFLLDAAMLGLFTKDALVITDNNPYTEFPLWRSYSEAASKYWLDAQWLMGWRNRNFPR
ncbi:MAG: fused MFS/spermidine synthase [Chitinivibrionales bacterium]